MSENRLERSYDRQPDELRPFTFERDDVPGAAPGRVLVRCGRTTVLCTASVDEDVPPWLVGKEKGWVTAEYNMLPSSTSPRKRRDRGPKVDGRTTEIQRLIGRSLRAIVDLKALGSRTITLDCDVLEADGGTRTASITGSMVALIDALRSIDALKDAKKLPLSDSVAAISVGIVDGRPVLDMDYREDVRAEVDMNVVMTGGGRFIELQGTGEEATFDREQLNQLVGLAEKGIAELTLLQREALGNRWPFSQ